MAALGDPPTPNKNTAGEVKSVEHILQFTQQTVDVKSFTGASF